MCLRTITLCVLLANAATAFAAPQQPIDIALPLNIAAQPIEDALNELARQTGLQVAVYSEIGQGHTAPAVSGTLTPRDALQQLLAGTELTYDLMDGNTIAIHPVKAKSTSTLETPAQGIYLVQSSEGQTRMSADDTQAQNSPSSSEADTRKIEEVIVTAQKRSERLQDVPVPVTAINANSLFENSQLRLQDYYTKVPGLNLVTALRGEAQISIRGIFAATGTNPTVGITVDDVPYGSSVLWGNGSSTPDLDPSDLARIEVLRGPQGTLYGANSSGGLLKFVTVDPSTDSLNGRIEGGINDVYNGGELGYSLRGAVNVPLTDTFAVRMSGFTRREAGYIDNPVNATEGVNQTDIAGGRLSALWQPSRDVSLKLSALMQDSRRNATPTVNLAPGLGDLQQNAIRNTGRFDRTFEVYSAILKAALGPVDLTSLSGYNVNKIDALIQAGTVPTYENTRTRKFSQEVRLSGPMGENFDWLMGGFYTRENNDSVQERAFLTAGVPNNPTGAPSGNRLFIVFPTSYTEYAAFANLTYRVTDRFDVQVGGRESHNKQTYARTAIGADSVIVYGLPSPVVTPERRQKDSSFTYLLTPRFKVSPDLMVYGRFASGYRPGSNNTGLPSVPTTYDADTTLNYEFGAKGNLFDRTLSFDVSLYYIDWKDIQITVVPIGTATSYTANVGKAKSQGVELSLELRPVSGMTISAWGAYNDAQLTENFPPTITVAGGAGQRLPFSAPWSGNFSINQEVALTGNMTGFLGASLSYVGDRRGVFVSGAARRQTFPSYAQLDVHAGVELDSWKVNLYANNIADKRGAITGDPTVIPTGVVYIQPRTVGLSLAKGF